jgi:hypothetical protein
MIYRRRRNRVLLGGFRIAAVLLAGLFFAPACKERSRDGGSFLSDEESFPGFTLQGFAAVQYAPVYQVNGDSAEWIGALDFGEALTFDLETAGVVSAPKKYVDYPPYELAVDEQWVYLIPVIGGELRGWISRSCYAPRDAVAGAVIGSEIVLGDSETLRPGDLAVFSPGDPLVLIAPFGVHRNFSIQYFNQEANRSKISFNAEDVEAAKLLAKARGLRGGERSRALLREAAEKYPDSALAPLIRESLNPGGETAAGPVTESLAARFSVAEDNTAVYGAPDFSAAVMGRLEQYAEARTVERTLAQSRTRAGSARWYHISEPVEGWVFGLGLEGAD